MHGKALAWRQQQTDRCGSLLPTPHPPPPAPAIYVGGREAKNDVGDSPMDTKPPSTKLESGADVHNSASVPLQRPSRACLPCNNALPFRAKKRRSERSPPPPASGRELLVCVEKRMMRGLCVLVWSATPFQRNPAVSSIDGRIRVVVGWMDWTGRWDGVWTASERAVEEEASYCIIIPSPLTQTNIHQQERHAAAAAAASSLWS